MSLCNDDSDSCLPLDLSLTNLVRFGKGWGSPISRDLGLVLCPGIGVDWRRLPREKGFFMARQRRKADLPQKICPVCQRPFTWRKKWADCWEEVKYCSERCRRRRSPPADPTSQPG